MLSSCQPPSESLTVRSVMPPSDFEIVMIINEEIEITGHKSRSLWEVNYYFEYEWSLPWDDEAGGIVVIETVELRVTAWGETFKINTGARILDDFHSIVKLDIRNRAIEPGTSLSRSIFLVSLRLCLILAVAGALFYLFRYREKRSWIAFAIISLPGEFFINIFIDGANLYVPMGGLIVLLMILFLCGVNFILKLIAMCIAINEHRRLRTILYILTAHAVISVLYILLIAFLPL